MYSPPTNYTAPGDGVTLQQIIVIHRHGDRAPISPSAGTVVLDGEMWEPRLPTAEEQKAWDEMHPVSGPSKAVDIDIAPFGQLTSRNGFLEKLLSSLHKQFDDYVQCCAKVIVALVVARNGNCFL